MQYNCDYFFSSEQFPLHLLKISEKSKVLVEVKSGETYNGELEQIDKFMNIKLSDVIQTSKDGTSFHSIKEIFIKGNYIKYFRLVQLKQDIIFQQEQALNKCQEEADIYNNLKEDHQRKQQDFKKNKQFQRRQNQSQRGGPRGTQRGSYRGRGNNSK